ncbi:Polyribonucleotide 5'-hydroxyl-kinase Clp1, partial [Stegodyphus mimosarum]
MEGTHDDSTIFNLNIENELRFTVGEQTVSLELLMGFAEIFGAEMVTSTVYTFPPFSSIAVFSWQGCKLKLKGKTEAAYVVSDTLQMIHVHLHACLEERRIKAEAEDVKGPISLVVGPTDVGKSTFCRILLNYAARLGRKPIFIDLDVGQNVLSIPGNICILPMNKPADIIDGYDQQGLSVYHFGYKSPGYNIMLYFLLLKKLGHSMNLRLRNANKAIRSSGVIIDTCGWVRGHGYNSITLAAMAFEIDTLFVLEEERLYTQLKRDMPSCVNVVYVPKIGAVNERSRLLRSKIRDGRVWEYFYGSQTPLQPHSFQVKFSDIDIFKVATPYVNFADDITEISEMTLRPVQIGIDLVDQVLGLSSADRVDEDLMITNIIGFICIIAVDMDLQTVTVLSPQPSPLPKRILLMGNIRLS